MAESNKRVTENKILGTYTHFSGIPRTTQEGTGLLAVRGLELGLWFILTLRQRNRRLATWRYFDYKCGSDHSEGLNCISTRESEMSRKATQEFCAIRVLNYENKQRVQCKLKVCSRMLGKYIQQREEVIRDPQPASSRNSITYLKVEEQQR